MSTKTISICDTKIQTEVESNPFVYESIIRYEVDKWTPRILAYSVAVDPGVVRLFAQTQEGNSIEVLFDQPFTNGKEWIYVDSMGLPTNYAQRPATIIRDGVRIKPASVSGIGGVGVSSNLRKLFLLDEHGRRYKGENVRTFFSLEKVWVDVLRVDK